MENLLLILILIMPLLAIVLSLQGAHSKYCLKLASFFIILNGILSVVLFLIHNFEFFTFFYYGLFKNKIALGSDLYRQYEFNLFVQEWASIQESTVWFLIKNLFSIENIGTWINSGLLLINWGFSLNSINTFMLIVVNLISGLVHIYSLDYMYHDKKISKFFSYLALFTFFMLLLVLGDNFVILFLGWEGVGLCSYLLISFWYTRLQANKAAIKALVVNRVGDMALTLGILLIFFVFSTLTFETVFSLIDEYFFFNQNIFCNQQESILLNKIYSFCLQNKFSFIALLLFIGAMGKSAQIGLHTWLPDAMEGPTPVSALIHAATMVTAGVFLIIKCSPLFEKVPGILVIIVCVGGMTSFMAASIGLTQNDIKKVVAYSTCSQLGYMIFACGLSNYQVAFFHLVNHAFFKALLFLSAGAIIHSLSDEQDMRRFGGLFNIIPFTASMILLGSITLMGFPFLTGFYSKDVILEISYSKYTLMGILAYIFGLSSAFCTSFYSYRVFYLTFIQKNVTNRLIIYKTHELPQRMAYILSILGLGSIFFGYFTRELFIGLGSDFFLDVIYISYQNNNQIESEFLPQIIKLIPFWITLISIIVVNFLFFKSKVIFSIGRNFFYNLYNFLIFKWYFDWLYNKFINIPFLKLSFKLFEVNDKKILEWCGPFIVNFIFYKISVNLKKLQTGWVQHYLYLMLISFFFLIFEIFNHPKLT